MSMWMILRMGVSFDIKKAVPGAKIREVEENSHKPVTTNHHDEVNNEH